MRLLILTQTVDLDDPALGFFHTWIEQLAARTESIIVVCLKEGRHALPSNVRVVSLGKEGHISSIQYHVSMLKKVQYIKRCYFYIWKYRHEYDSVFVHMNPEYAILGGLLWRVWGKKVLLWYTHKAVNARLWLAEKFVTKIFTASKESFRLPSKKVAVVGHGIPVEAFPPCSPHALSLQSLKMLIVGRISPTKDLETSIMALQRLIDHFPGIHATLDIVGEPALPEDREYEQTIKELIEHVHLKDKVRLLGKRSHADIPAFYQSHDVFLHTSKTGSMDKVVLEAMATGMQVFSTSEAFTDSPNWSFLQNDPNGLAAGIEKACSAGILVPNEKAREYVKVYHGLSARIEDIVAFFKK